MAGNHRRRRRGHPRGKAYGFHSLRPASTQQSTKSSTSTGGTQTSATSSGSTSNTSSGS
jgi:hypothetical protein